MKWWRRFQDWRNEYPPNSVHVYCYHCAEVQTRGLLGPFSVKVYVAEARMHADDQDHLVQILTWCDTPALFKSGLLTRNVQDVQYGKGATDDS